MSMNEAKDKKISLEPLNPEQRVRKSGVPVGLKNIGNSTPSITKHAISTLFCRHTSKIQISSRTFFHTRCQRNIKGSRMKRFRNMQSKISSSKGN